jgi:hypothetical protein
MHQIGQLVQASAMNIKITRHALHSSGQQGHS